MWRVSESQGGGDSCTLLHEDTHTLHSSRLSQTIPDLLSVVCVSVCICIIVIYQTIECVQVM